MGEKVLVSWSGGKDSALALYEITQDGHYDVAALLTTLTRGYDRISMHGVRRELLEGQAQSLGVRLDEIFIDKDESDEGYRAKMEEAMLRYLARGIRSVVFGDLFLESVRQYRESNLAKVGMAAIFPLWQKDTRQLAHRFLDLGFKSIVTCVDSKVLGKEFVGRLYDEQFLSDLPPGVDPCGENGEFHSFAFGGPIFLHGIQFKVGEIVLKDNRFYYCDLIPT